MAEMNELVVLVIALLVGLSLLGGIISNLTDLTNTKSILDEPETLVLDGGCTAHTTHDNYVSNSTVTLINANGTLAEGTDYIICSGTDGLISAISAGSQGATNVNYSYYPDNYIENSMTRNFIGLYPFAFILALFMGAIVVAGFMRK